MTTPTQPNETGAGTPTQGQGQPPATGATPPAYVTREEIEAFKKELKDELSKSYRGAQSNTDKLQSKVQAELKRIGDTLSAFQAAGVQISKEQANDLKQQALLNAFSQPSGDGQASPQPGAGDEPDALTPEQQRVTNNAFELMKEYGVEIEDSDPEAALIEKASQGTEGQFYAAVTKACMAKQARLSQPPQSPTPPPNPQQTAARMPGLSAGGTGAANPIGSITDITTLLQMGLKDK